MDITQWGIDNSIAYGDIIESLASHNVGVDISKLTHGMT